MDPLLKGIERERALHRNHEFPVERETIEI
jgi:hypothetical protein